MTEMKNYCGLIKKLYASFKYSLFLQILLHHGKCLMMGKVKVQFTLLYSMTKMRHLSVATVTFVHSNSKLDREKYCFMININRHHHSLGRIS